CVIITHPYGRLGGNLHNNVVESCFQYFSGEGFMTVRFNFRGVGQSTGSSTLRGNGELDDVLSVYRYVKERPNLAPRHFILCGYSYGSIATGAVCPDIPECIGLISIAYPAGVLWFLTMGNSSRFTEGIRSVRENMPKLFIMGSKDNFTSVKSFQDFVASIPQPRQVKLIDGIDHFWFESEHIITECINLWM
ncbi:Alpha/Beta hydrolase protein, partial [Zopfochytrium polystomum]